MKNADFFDKVYFGYDPNAEPTSNYGRVGGYVDTMAAPEFMVARISDILAFRYRDLANLKILDVGCATGATVAMLRQHGFQAWGMDISPFIIAQASPDVRPYLAIGDMRSLRGSPVTDYGPFDLIVSKDVLEHATEDCIDDILAQMNDLAPLQYHIVNTGEDPHQAFDGDQSHFIRRPLTWWSSHTPDGATIIWEATT